MFVCTGNICRSPLAHRVLEKILDERGLSDRVAVESSGTGAWHVGEDADSRMRATAARHGLPFHHGARHLTRREVESYDLLFAMDRGHYRHILGMADGDVGERLYVFRQFDPELTGGGDRLSVDRAPDVPDPYYGGADGFEAVYAMVERTCRAIVDHLEAGTLP
jgi:protein-tyrosine phosphatase